MSTLCVSINQGLVQRHLSLLTPSPMFRRARGAFWWPHAQLHAWGEQGLAMPPKSSCPPCCQHWGLHSQERRCPAAS